MRVAAPQARAVRHPLRAQRTRSAMRSVHPMVSQPGAA
ncbi:conserved hypothetical protein [Burkholderia pseudomallei 406e]|nr:hypothetical protein BURPS305_5138 [Burkholderia pseudomallei 305]EDO87511.1 conserved hypothetical protein [Burkholderia pseudomallei 406e]